MSGEKIGGIVAGVVFVGIVAVGAYKFGTRNETMTVKVEGLPADLSNAIVANAQSEASRAKSASHIRQIFLVADLENQAGRPIPSTLAGLKKANDELLIDTMTSPLTATQYDYELRGRKLLVFENSSSGGNLGVLYVGQKKQVIDWYDSTALAAKLAAERQ